MNISGISQCQLPSLPGKMSDGFGHAEGKIRVLEKKLQELDAEKEKAAKNRDGDRVKRLEKQMEEIRKQIEQLRNRVKGQGIAFALCLW